MNHKAGYVSIVGYPNVGKSTLMNALLGDKLSIISSKPQTTRHRILGIYNDENYQIVFSDSPGIISETAYAMQDAMNVFAYHSLEDADLTILLTDPFDQYTESDPLIKKLKSLNCPVFLIINKMDLKPLDELETLKNRWQKLHTFHKIFFVSALQRVGLDDLMEQIKEVIPSHPPFFP